MTKRRFKDDVDALKKKLDKLSKQYDNTSEAAVVKRTELFNRAAKIEEEISKLQK